MQLCNLDLHDFTVHKSPHINCIVASQIREVSELVLRRIKDAISFILLGGYARGEGSIILTSNGLIPLGDYDFLLVTKYPHKSLHLPELGLLRKKFRLQYTIEVANTWKALLPFVDKRIYWYEAKFGSKLVYGDAHVLNAIQISNSSDIDPKEGFSLMFNRLMGMLSVFDLSFLEHDPTREQKEHLIFQSVKGILACGESLLLLSGDYHYSYRKRAQRFADRFEESFSELKNMDPSLEDDFERASRFKLCPSYDMYNDSVKLWFSARRHLLHTLAFFLARTNRVENDFLTNRPFDRFPKRFLSCSKPDFLDYLMFNWRAFATSKSLKGLPNIDCAFSDIVRLAIYYLTLSVSEDGHIDSHLLEESLKTIKAAYTVNVKIIKNDLQSTWKQVQKAIFSAWQCSRQ